MSQENVEVVTAAYNAFNRVDQGLIVRAEEYFKREEALQAAGLSE